MKIKDLINIMKKYWEAWEKQDTKKLLDLFDEDWTYQDKPFNTPMKLYKEIEEYWTKYPLSDQKNIKFYLWKCWIYGWTWYAEWTSNFDQIESWKHVEIRGIILIKLKNWKIKNLWEYWHSEKS